MNTKKLLSLIIAAAIVLCGCKATDPMENFYMYWNVQGEGDKTAGICVVYCSLETEEIQVPETISGQKVVEIGSAKVGDNPYKGAFEECPSSVKRIIIPEGVYEIDERVFADSISIENVVLPQSLEILGENVFYYCESLDNMAVPENITELPKGLFTGCKSLKTVTLSKELTSIGNQSFYGCGSLEKIELPPTLTSIGELAFASCKSLSEITLPEGLVSIGEFAFDKCKSLTDITLPDSLEVLGKDAFDECFDITVHYGGEEFGYDELGVLYEGLRAEESVVVY